MQRGHYYLRRRNFLAIDVHRFRRNSAAVVDNRDRIIDVNGDFDFVGMSGKRLVNGVVHNFVDKMMEPELAGRANVHSRAFAHRFHAAENFDRISGIVAVRAVHASFAVFGFFFVSECG